MKRPEITRKGVESLALENVGQIGQLQRAKTAATMAGVNAVTKALDTAVVEIDKYETSKANSMVINAMADLDEIEQMDVLPANDPRIAGLNFDALDTFGNVREEIPVHEFYAELYEETATKALDAAEQVIGLPGSRRDWSMDMRARHTQNIAKTKGMMQKKRRNYMIREQEMMIQSAMNSDRFGVAQTLVNDYIGTPAEKELLQSRIGRAQQKYVGRKAREAGGPEFAEYAEVIDAEAEVSDDPVVKEEKEFNDEHWKFEGNKIVDNALIANDGDIDAAKKEIEAMSPNNAKLLNGETYKTNSPLEASLVNNRSATPELAEETVTKFNETSERFGGGKMGQLAGLAVTHSGTSDKTVEKAIQQCQDSGKHWTSCLPKNTRIYMEKVIQGQKTPTGQWPKLKTAIDNQITWHEKRKKMETTTDIGPSASHYRALERKALSSEAEMEKFLAMNPYDHADRMTPAYIKMTIKLQEIYKRDRNTASKNSKVIDSVVGDDDKAFAETSVSVNEAMGRDGKPMTLKQVKEEAANVLMANKAITFADVPKKEIDAISTQFKERFGREPTAQEVTRSYQYALEQQ